MPDAVGRLVESIMPLALESIGNRPAELLIAHAHAHKMTLLISTLAVDKGLAAVKDGQVVDEVNVSSASLNLHLSSLGNGFDSIKSLNLTSGQGWKVCRSGMSRVAHQGGPTKVDNDLSIMMKENRTALELGTKVWSGDNSGKHGRPGMQLEMFTYRAKGQSERDKVRIMSGRVAARTL